MIDLFTRKAKREQKAKEAMRLNQIQAEHDLYKRLAFTAPLGTVREARSIVRVTDDKPYYGLWVFNGLIACCCSALDKATFKSGFASTGGLWLGDTVDAVREMRNLNRFDLETVTDEQLAELEAGADSIRYIYPKSKLYPVYLVDEPLAKLARNAGIIVWRAYHPELWEELPFLSPVVPEDAYPKAGDLLMQGAWDGLTAFRPDRLEDDYAWIDRRN